MEKEGNKMETSQISCDDLTATFQERNSCEYSIGKVSKLLGISIEGIRNYEKCGIVHPRREPDSQYRKFSYLDITSLIRAKMYRSLGFSLLETETLVNMLDIPELVNSFEEKIVGLERDLQLAKSRGQFLDNLSQEIAKLEKELNVVEIRLQPEAYRLEFSKNGVIDFSDRVVQKFQTWMEYMPFVHVSTRYLEKDVYGGLSIDERYAELFDIKEEPGLIRHLPPVLSMKITVMEEENGFSDFSCIKDLKKYAAEHSYLFKGEIIGQTVIGTQKKNNYRRYRQIYAPIEEP